VVFGLIIGLVKPKIGFIDFDFILTKQKTKNQVGKWYANIKILLKGQKIKSEPISNKIRI
jgi:hypothetical protein